MACNLQQATHTLLCVLLLAAAQATASTADTKGQAPVFANVYKYLRRNAFLKDQDRITKYIGENTVADFFSYIVTRPGMTREAASKKRLAASKSVSDAHICCVSFVRFAA